MLCRNKCKQQKAKQRGKCGGGERQGDDKKKVVIERESRQKERTNRKREREREREKERERERERRREKGESEGERERNRNKRIEKERVLRRLCMHRRPFKQAACKLFWSQMSRPRKKSWD